MDNNPELCPRMKAQEKAIKLINIGNIVNPGTKKRKALTYGRSDRAKKPRKWTASPQVDEGAQNDRPLFQKTPTTKRMPSHSSMIKQETIAYAPDMETQIVAEARGVTRKSIPCDTFRSLYLGDFVKAQSKLTVDSVKKIGEGDWDEALFWNRLRQSLSNELLRDLHIFYGGTKTLHYANKGNEAASKPVLHIGEEDPMWADVELLLEHTPSNFKNAITPKFTQWLRGAWSVFNHQPFRLHLYGILFLQPCAYICCADHGCAVYSEPLRFVTNIQHAQFLADFLTGFIANPRRRGRDPTVEKADKVYIHHAETTWAERPKGLLCYRPSLIGRNIRVAQVQDQGAKFREDKMVMKNTWEEKLPPESSPPSEIEVLKILEANVRGLPQLYALENAIVRDDGNLEVETRSFHKPENLAPGENADDLLPRRAQIQRQQFNKPLEVRRRLTRVLMSYCVPLREAMRTRGPKSLMRIIRDAMTVYYEAYKAGFIYGDISIENILVVVEGCVLTGGLTYIDRSGTLIDWNLCFNALGESTNRSFRSGTPLFMASVLLEDEKVARRTLGHDMESFFAVIIWMATLNYADDAAFLAKPLAKEMLDKKTPTAIVVAKELWFGHSKGFKKWIINHFEPLYRKDIGFLKCLLKLRGILYPEERLDTDAFLSGSLNDNDVAEDADPMKEGLFQQCMKEIDDYLDETNGCDEIQRIDSKAQAQQSPESLMWV